MRLRWPTKFLPGFPAILLVPAFLGLWATLCVTHSDYEWSSISLPGTRVISIPPEGLEPSYNPRGFPFTFSGSWEERETKPVGVEVYDEIGFQIHWFLVDLIIALAVGYLLAMRVDRLVFPLVRRLQKKKPEQGEPS